jgi:hypothetical protein
MNDFAVSLGTRLRSWCSEEDSSPSLEGCGCTTPVPYLGQMHRPPVTSGPSNTLCPPDTR